MEEPKKNKKVDSGIPTIETYMSDMADAVRNQEASVVKIAAEEQKRRERGGYYKNGPQKKSNLKPWFTIGGIILILGAIFIFYSLSQKKKSANEPVEVVAIDNSLISYDSKVNLDATNITTKDGLTNLVNKSLDQKSAPQSIKEINLTKQDGDTVSNLSLNDIFSILKTAAPGSLLRSFGENYMLGIYTPPNQDESNNLFIIMKTKDYDLAYAGMLSWEKTMVSDLFSLFHIDISHNSDLLKKPFSDIIIKNQDARVLDNNTGEGILYYIFPNKDTMIISNNQQAINEIVTRLLIKETKPIQ